MQKFISNLSPVGKMLFYVACLFALFAILDRVFVGPAWNKLKDTSAEIEQQKINIRHDLRFLAHEDRIIKESSQYQEFYTIAAEHKRVSGDRIIILIDEATNNTAGAGIIGGAAL